jgi:hypothetical protein
MSSGGRNPVDVNEVAKRHESRILISVLSEFLLLGMDRVGALSTASSKTDMWALAAAGVMDAVHSPVNRIEIPRLMRYNGFKDPRVYPTLVPGDLEKIDLSEFASFITSMTGAGALVPDDELERRVKDMGGLSGTSARRLPI